MALSRIFKIGDVYSRIAVRCGQVENFKLDPNSLTRIMRDAIMTIFISAIASGKKYYYTKGDGTVSGGEVDISSLNMFELQSVAYEDGTNSRAYMQAQNPNHFNNCRVAWNHEFKGDGRVWFMVQGADKIMVFQGADISGEDTLQLYYVRYPEAEFTMADIEANSIFIDLVEWMVPHFVSYCSGQAVKEQNLQLPADLQQDFAAALGALDVKVQQTEDAAEAKRRDTL